MLSHRFKFWLIVGLLIANLAIGIVSLYFLRSVNARYAGLFEHGIPVINSLRTLAREQTALQRSARLITESQDDAHLNDLVTQMDHAGDRLWVHVTDLSATALLKDTKHAEALRQASQDYETQVDAFLRIAHEQKQAAAARFNNEVLRPAYDRMQLALDEAATYVEQQGSNLRDRYAQESRFFGGLSLAFAGWPVVAVGIMMLVLGVLVFMLFLTIFTPENGWRHKQGLPPS